MPTLLLHAVVGMLSDVERSAAGLLAATSTQPPAPTAGPSRPAAVEPPADDGPGAGRPRPLPSSCRTPSPPARPDTGAARAPDVAAWAARVHAAVAAEDGGWTRRATGDRSGPPSDPATLTRLRGWVYADAHLGVDVTETDGAGIDAPSVVALLARLVPGRWASAGWRVLRRLDGARPDTPRRDPPRLGPSRPDTSWEVERDGLRLRVTADDLCEGAVQTGDEVVVRLPRARPGALPGWFAVTGPGGPAPASDGRVYLHPRRLDRTAVAAVLAALDGLDGLDGVGGRWQVKVSIRPSGAARPDCVVAYLPRREVAAAVDHLGARLDGLLADPVPGFSVRAAPGLAWSVDLPYARGGSYGARVADVCARALVAGDDLEQRLAAAVGGGTP